MIMKNYSLLRITIRFQSNLLKGTNFANYTSGIITKRIAESFLSARRVNYFECIREKWLRKIKLTFTLYPSQNQTTFIPNIFSRGFGLCVKREIFL